MNNFNKTKTILICTIIVLVVVLIFDVLYFKFINEDASKIYDLHKTFFEEYSQNYRVSNLERNLSEVVSKEESINRLFLSKDKIVEFIGQVEDLGEKSSVVIKTQTVDVSGLVDEETNKNNPYGNLNIILIATGEWDKVYKFIKLVENLSYYSEIASVKLSSSNVDNKILWSANISIDVSIKAI